MALAIQYKDWEAESIDLRNNERIGDEAVKALVEALSKLNHQNLKLLKFSDLGPRSLNLLRNRAEKKKIKIISEFPCLLTIAKVYISDILEQKIKI